MYQLWSYYRAYYMLRTYKKEGMNISGTPCTIETKPPVYDNGSIQNEEVKYQSKNFPFFCQEK